MKNQEEYKVEYNPTNIIIGYSKTEIIPVTAKASTMVRICLYIANRNNLLTDSYQGKSLLVYHSYAAHLVMLTLHKKLSMVYSVVRVDASVPLADE